MDPLKKLMRANLREKRKLRKPATATAVAQAPVWGVSDKLSFRLAISALNETVAESVVGKLPFSYESYLKTVYWKIRRQLYLEFYDGCCVRCCKRKPRLALHHVSYERLRCELMSDLLLLCRGCHQLEEIEKEIGK